MVRKSSEWLILVGAVTGGVLLLGLQAGASKIYDVLATKGFLEGTPNLFGLTLQLWPLLVLVGTALGTSTGVLADGWVSRHHGLVVLSLRSAVGLLFLLVPLLISFAWTSYARENNARDLLDSACRFAVFDVTLQWLLALAVAARVGANRLKHEAKRASD